MKSSCVCILVLNLLIIFDGTLKYVMINMK